MSTDDRSRRPTDGPPRAARCALIWTDIGHYHAARSSAAHAIASLEVETIEVLASSEYKEFRVDDTGASRFTRRSLGLARPLRAAAARGPIAEALARLRPDVVFVPGWGLKESLLAIEWCLANRVPFVMMSESTRQDFSRSPLKEALKRRILGLAQAALVGGRAQADYAAELGMPRARIFLGYDVVDNGYFAVGADRARANAAALRAEHGLPQHYFLCSARLIEKKNLLRLLDAFAAYRARAGAAVWDLVVIGPGPLEDRIRARIAELGLEASAHLAGAKGYAVLPDYYGLASAFVLPSTMDQWGLVVNEAMAAGLPVLVSTHCGCHRELVEDGRNGFTFDPFDVAAMGEAMLRVAAAECDRKAIGEASRQIISDWGPDRFAEGFAAAAKIALDAPAGKSSLLDCALLRALTAW